MSNFIRCPICYLRMKKTNELVRDQQEFSWRTKQEKAGALFVDWSKSEEDTRGFPCTRCGAQIERGALVRGVYEETIPDWALFETVAIAVITAFVFGWLLQWGTASTAFATIVSAITSSTSFVDLHHALIENRKLRELGLPAASLPLGTIKFASGLLLTIVVADLFFQAWGWVGIVASVIVILTGIGFIGMYAEKKRSQNAMKKIGQSNQAEIARIKQTKHTPNAN